METLLIPRIVPHPTAGMAGLGAALDAAVSATRLTCVNWPAFPYRPDVTFRIAHTGVELLLKFDVRETSVRALETRTHGSVYKDSCVELFIAFGDAGYYNLELNCIGTPHLAYGTGRADRQFVPLPLMERMTVRSSLGTAPFDEKTGDCEWSLTARIPLACFAFGAPTALDDRAARMNACKCGDGLTARHYVTWQPIHTPAPDYHRPEFFGSVRFAEA